MIIRKRSKVYYNQLTQTLPILFSWAKSTKEGFEAQYYGAMCKEYLTDVIRWHLKGLNREVYGLRMPKNFKHENLMLLEFPHKESKAAFASNVDLFAEFGWPVAIVADCEDDFVIQLDPEWTRTAWRIALCALMVKVFSHQANKTKQNAFKTYPGSEGMHIQGALMKYGDRFQFFLDHFKEIEVDAFDYVRPQWDEQQHTCSVHSHIGVFSEFFYDPNEGICERVYQRRLLALMEKR